MRRCAGRCSAARTPVVSAIGHETDAPLIDYVADARASTPTDAAKRIVPDLAEERQLIDTARRRLDRAVSTLLDREEHRIEAWRSRPSLARPELLIDQRAADVLGLRDRAVRSLESRLRRADDDLRHTVARLRALSPRSTLQRGYAIVQRADGHVVRAADEVDNRRSSPGTAGRRRAAGNSAGAGMTDEKLSYEQARTELAGVVERLETGGSSLEESLALWERGEKLADVCQQWLDGARERIEAGPAPPAPRADLEERRPRAPRRSSRRSGRPR